MTLLLGCIADDYTGASDLASMLSANNLRTVQTIGVPRDTLPLPDADAVVISLKSRSIAPGEAVTLSLQAYDWLQQRGVRHVMFKICSTFDSTDDGNIGPVMDALRQRANGSIVLVTPAFPETGRAVFEGTLFVNGVLLHESPLKDHPLNPMRDSNLVRVLARQSNKPVGLVSFAAVELGVNAVTEAMQSAQADGKGALIADAIAARHLDILGEAALSGPLSVGASGLGSGLARALVALHPQRPANQLSWAKDEPSVGPFSAILAGSCSVATRKQVAAAEMSGVPCLQLDVTRLFNDERDSVVDEACRWALDRLPVGPVVIASSDAPERVREMQASHGGTEAGHVVEQALADIADTLVGAGVGRLIVAGGETSGAIVDRLSLEAFRVGPQIAPGVPALLTEGRSRAGLKLALKSGNFGDADFFAKALAMLE